MYRSRDHAVIGGAAAIHQFVRIGRAAMIGGVSGVEGDVIPFGSVIGNRARLAGLNVIGLKRRGFDKAQIQLLHNAFRDLFRHEGVFAQRLAATRARYGDEALVAEVLAFIDAPSHRGPDPRGVAGGGGAPAFSAFWPAAAGCPGQVAAAARAAGRSVFLVGLEGFAEPAVLAPWPHEIVRIGAAGRIIAALREHGCRDLVLIGPVRRPSLLDLRPDAEGARILARIGRAAFAGDDGLLAAVVQGAGRGGLPRPRRARDPERGAGSRRAAVAGRARRGGDGGHSRAASPWPARSVRSMSARAAWCSRGSCWRSRRPRAPTRCWRAAHRWRGRDAAVCW